MEYVPVILQGLSVTLFISIVSLLVGIIPGISLYLGKKSKIKIFYIISTAYVEFFDGIPVIAQLFFIYYALPMISPVFTFSSILTGIIVLSLNAAANIASTARLQIENNFIAKDSPTTHIIKVLTLSTVNVSNKVIGYSALLSLIGLNDLLRTTNKIMSVTGTVFILLGAIAIYLVMSIVIKIIYKLLKKAFNMEYVKKPAMQK